jgi:RNA polymerase-binding transcription factor DksA
LDEKDIKKKLIALKKEVTHRINSIDRDIRHEGMTADWSEQASERENDEVLESLGNSSEQELEMIKFALHRLENGTYFRKRGQMHVDRETRPGARTTRAQRRYP